ncbi:aminotransferase class V-fold PLP-dependent enzyme, partial [Paenibacillus sp. EKM208P]
RKMHEHGGVCFVDFSASAPYAEINMHPTDPLEKLDGIVFSPHKFLGGPGTSGVLIMDSRLCLHCAPDQPGGGTVSWTN